METRHSPPWAGLAFALTGGGAMLLAGAGLWLTLGIVVLWAGTLWLLRPEPAGFTLAPDFTGTAREARSVVIEPIGIPLVLLEGQRIVEANAAARAALGAHITGQDARIVLRHPEAVRLLDLADGESVTIPGFVGGRSLWQLTRRRIDENRWLIELRDRTAEADLSRAQTDFVANASHELRTPLAAVIGYVETLVDRGDAVDAATKARFHQTVLREARRMEALVSDLMSLSQVEAEKHDLPSVELDFGKLALRVAGEAAALAGKERVAAEVPEQPVLLQGDRAQLEQLVRNLVDNALKYGAADSPVRLALEVDDAGKAVLAVTDKGAGIAPEHIPHLTRRFYRTDPGRSREAGGTGLGLAICKHIVERHRGTLDISSRLGVGTTVTVRFPTAPGAPPPGNSLEAGAVS